MQTIMAPSYIGDYIFKKTIGEGAFSVVKLAFNTVTNQYVACKIIPHLSIASDSMRARFEGEIRINQQLHHPGIVQIIDLLKDQINSYIFMEFCPNGELFQYIVDKSYLREEEAKVIIYQVLKALKYVHAIGIAHRDLKPENLLFDKFGRVKIGDFGLSRFVGKNQLVGTPCGSPCYASPECLSGSPYDGMKSDMWSLGVIIFATVTGHLPWTKKNQYQLFDQIKKGEYSIPMNLSLACQDLIRSMMTVDPKKRITDDQALKHKWFEGVQDISLNCTEGYTLMSLKKVDQFFAKANSKDIFSSFHNVDKPEIMLSQKDSDFLFVTKEIQNPRILRQLPSGRAGRKSAIDSARYRYIKPNISAKNQLETFGSASVRQKKLNARIVRPRVAALH